MRIAIPTEGGRLCVHFGHCEKFALIDVDEQKNTIEKVEYVVPPPHEPGVLPPWLASQGANLVLAGGLGQRAISLFSQHDIRVIIGVASATPEEAVTAFLADDLKSGDNLCTH